MLPSNVRMALCRPQSEPRRPAINTKFWTLVVRAAVVSLVLTLSTGMVNYTSAQDDEPKRLFCEPAEGLSVDDVESTNDLGECRFPKTSQEQPAEGEIEVVVDYPDSTGGTTRRQNLGMNKWNGDQLTLPSPVPAGAWLVLHGDASPEDQYAGGCVVMVFAEGEEVTGVSQGTFQAVLLTNSGDSDRIDETRYLQEVAKLEAVDCPLVRAPEGVDLPVETESEDDDA